MPSLPTDSVSSHVAAAAAVVASGVGFGASMPPWPTGLFACVAWVPLLERWRHVGPRRMAVEAFLAQIVAAGTGFAWVLRHPSPATVAASAGGLLTWAFLFSLPWTVAAAARRRWGMPVGVLALLAAQLAVEGTLSRGPWAFPWGFWGHAMAEVPGVRALAAAGGVGLLSAWVGGVNAVVFWGWRAWRSETQRLRGPLIALTLLVLLPAAYHRLGAAPPEPASTPSPGAASPTALLIQPGTPPEAWADVGDAGRVGRLRAQTTAALDSLSPARREGVSLIVWPETALPALDGPDRRRALYRSLQAWVDSLHRPLLTGGVAVAGSSDAAAVRTYANRTWLFRPSSRTAEDSSAPAPAAPEPATYDKRYLVPFAERVPLVDALPFLHHLRVPAGGVAGYRRGEGPAVWPTPLGAVTPLICFESVITPYAATATRRGAQVLVTVAQTGWWGPGAGPAQHLAFTRLTAVATGRPVVLTTVSGPSTVVRPSGEVARTPATGPSAFGRQAGAAVAVDGTANVTTPYTRTGDLPFFLAAFLTASTLLALTRQLFVS